MTSKNRVVQFPFSKVSGPNRNRPIKDLGYSKLALSLNPTGERCVGHWCSQCEGVWFGIGPEVECPVCGNRHG
ncbi:MAG: hypothetical protein CMI63_14345 [Parvularcula sp.]|nr:hypothetical protein [Parvularcula sp.]